MNFERFLVYDVQFEMTLVLGMMSNFLCRLDIWGPLFRDSVSYLHLFSLAPSDTAGEGVAGQGWQ